MNTTSTKVVTSVQRRRRWTRDQKAAVVEETYKDGNTVSEGLQRTWYLSFTTLLLETVYGKWSFDRSSC